MHLQRPGRATIVKFAVILIAAALFLIPVPSRWVERVYSNGVYPRAQHVATSISNVIPVAVFDLLLAGSLALLVAVWLVAFRRAGTGNRLAAVPTALLNTATLAAAILVWFMLAWGFNYQRIPLESRLDYDTSRVNLVSAKLIARMDVTRLNELSAEVHAKPWPSSGEWKGRLASSFQSVVAQLGNSRGTVPGRPKVSVLNPYFTATGVQGFTDPFALEVILNSHLLPQEVPFSLAHEWGHLAGYADESEANFIALLTCLRSEDPAVQYSGWLELYQSLPRNLFRSPVSDESKSADAVLSGPNLTPKLDPLVAADLEAIRKRLQDEIKPWISNPESRVYDSYLKSNHVAAGITSYGLFIRLLLGTRFDRNWVPVMKQP